MFVSLHHKNSDMKHLLIFFSTLFILTACSKDDDANVTPPTPAERTILVYISGENDLSSYADADISEMAVGFRALSKSANLVLFVDKAGQLPFIAKMTKDQQQPLDTLYKYEQDFYASDPDQMRDIVERCISYCPATVDYGLILWGHANGWVIMNDSVATRRAYGRDTGNNMADRTGGKWLNIPSMRKAFEQTGRHWEFIFCDCCNMGNAEAVYELRNTANYIVASPAEIPGAGAPYDKIMPALFTLGVQGCKGVADAYADAYSNHVPMVVVQTSQMQQLAQATRNILQTLQPTADKELNLNGLMYYDGKNEENLRSLFDMNDFLLQNAAASDYAVWKQALDKAVIHKRFAARWTSSGHVNFSMFTATEEKFGGLSMYIPRKFYDNHTYSENYNRSYNKMSWYYAVGWSDWGW